jgi:hypothetical protein
MLILARTWRTILPPGRADQETQSKFRAPTSNETAKQAVINYREFPVRRTSLVL